MKKENLHNNSDTFLAKWLEGELTDNELKNLVSPEDFVAYLKLKKGLETKALLERPIDTTFSEIEKRISNKKIKVRPLYFNWAIGIAASIIVFFGLFTIIDNGEVVIETSYGESKSIALIGGSEVILNSKSKIVYDKEDWKNDRQLYLDGEAYFKVAKGKTFTVKTNNGSVTVLGTQFNVNSTKDFFDVVCYEGKVRVSTLDSEHVLLPTDAVRKVSENNSKISKTSEKIPAWIYGESTFKSVPLRYVLSALEDEYKVRFDTESIDNSEIFTGSFPHDSLNIALKTVFETLNITYTEKEKRNIKLRYKE